jgi:hypothetical protein
MHVPVITLVARTMVDRMLRRPWPVLLVVCWCVASSAAAQSALTGIVHDPSGRVAVGAAVTVKDVKTGTQVWHATVSSIGYFEIELPDGDYEVEAHLGELSFTGTIHVYPEEKTAFDIELQAHSQVKETVIGRTSAGAFGPGGATSATFSNEKISTMPLPNGRTLQSLQSLVPGIVVTDSNGSQAQFTAAGQRRFSNRLTIDGVSADLAIDIGNLGISEGETGTLPAVSTLGGTQTIVPMAAIEEIQIRTTDTPPSEARSPGAQTIIVTRAGSDRFAGDAFTDFRPQRLGAADWFSTAVTPVSTTVNGPASSLTNGASAGGPVLPQRVFYFAAWERQRVTRPVNASVLVPSLATREQADESIKPLFDAFPVPNGPEAAAPFTGLAQLSADFPAVSTLSSLFLRLDANLAPNHRLFGRANIGRSSGDSLDASQIPATSYDNIESTRTKTGMLGLTSAFSSSLTNEARFSVFTNGGWLSAGQSSHVASTAFPRDALLPEDSSQVPVASGVSPWVSISVPGFNASISSGSRMGNAQELLQFTDTMSLSRGRHEFRVGVDARWQTSSTNPPPEVYAYSFNQLGAFFQGNAALTLTNNSSARVRFTRIALFAEDSFRVSRRFSLGYGVRYNVEPAPSNLASLSPVIFDADSMSETEDPQERPAGAPLWKTSWSNIAPRVAATYQFGTGTTHETTFRGLWNLSFDELTATSANVFGSNYPYVARRIASVTTFPVSPSVRSTPEAKTFAPNDRNTYYASPGTFRTPRSYGWQIGFDQALGRVQRLSVAYAGAAGRDLPYWYTSSVSTLPHVLRVTAFSNDAQSDYHALLAEYVWRLSHGLQAQVSYTWSHAIDIDSGELGLGVTPNPPPGRISPSDNRGSADFDRRHVLQTVASYQLPRLAGSGILHTIGTDWQVDAVFAFRSGAPFTVTSVRDIGFGSFPFRADAMAGVPVWVPDQTEPGGQRLNAEAFVTPTDRQGTLGRNTLRASPLRQVDVGLSRVIRLGERVTARLRLEAFNVFNIPNFGTPFADPQNTQQFGSAFRSYATALGTGTLTGGGLVPIQQVGGPRSVQLGLRLTY